MKLLITGGAGFIGSNFIFYLREQYPEYDIVCVDALTYAGNLETLSSILDNKEFIFIKANIADRETVYKIFNDERPDAVVNFAAESHVDRSIKDPEVFLKTNILGTQVLLDACKKFETPRFHQVSTDEVYGDLPIEDKELFFTESTPIRTSSPYSASKASADLLVQAYYRTYGLPVTISRCSNNYGPYQFPEKLIPLIISRACNNQQIPVYGKGENIRDWLYVEDHCKAIDAILHRGKEGEVYNVGGQNEYSNLEIVKIVLRLLNKPDNLITFVKDRPGHDMRYAIDPSKIYREMGWQPDTQFEDGIIKTIEWYLNNTGWWNHIINGEYKNYFEKMYE